MQNFQEKLLNLKLKGGDAQLTFLALAELARRIRESGEADPYGMANHCDHVADVLAGQVGKAADAHDRALKAGE